MRMAKKNVIVIFMLPLCLMFLLNIIEIVRFRVFSFEEPLIVLDQTFCSKDDIYCFWDGNKYTQEYISVGFTVRIEYHLNGYTPIDNDNDNTRIYPWIVDYSITKTTFLLFYIIPISF